VLPGFHGISLTGLHLLGDDQFTRLKETQFFPKSEAKGENFPQISWKARIQGLSIVNITKIIEQIRTTSTIFLVCPQNCSD
jgi:hypothetical protein